MAMVAAICFMAETVCCTAAPPSLASLEAFCAMLSVSFAFSVFWLTEALIPYWSGAWVLPSTHAKWEEAFRSYIYDPPDISAYIDEMTLDEYYAARLADVKKLGGTNADYFEVFKQMVFAIEVGVVLPSMIT